MDDDSKEVQKEKFIINCYIYSQAYSCTSANQQSVHLNDRQDTQRSTNTDSMRSLSRR